MAVVEDVFSRMMIVGWSIATHLRASLATEALEMAVWKRGASVEGLIHHSDAGSQGDQYTSVVYSERLAEHGIAPSVGAIQRDRLSSVQDHVREVFRRSMRRSHVTVLVTIQGAP